VQGLNQFQDRILFKRRSTQRRHRHCALAGCSKAEPKIFTLPQTPFPGAQDSQNLIGWRRSLPLPTNPNAISSYRGNRPINTQTHPQTGPITIYCAAASVQ